MRKRKVTWGGEARWGKKGGGKEKERERILNGRLKTFLRLLLFSLLLLRKTLVTHALTGKPVSPFDLNQAPQSVPRRSFSGAKIELE